MKTLNRFFSIIALACLMTVSAVASDPVVYDNGPFNGTDAWSINFGYWVSDSFYLGTKTQVTGVDFYVWEFPGDQLSHVHWRISPSPANVTASCTAEVDGIAYANPWGNLLGGVLTDTYITLKPYGYDIDRISIKFPDHLAAKLDLLPCIYELRLYDAFVPSGDPVYWDENSGAGCKSNGCPSTATESAVGSIPSETFDVRGH
jgi:hypothetical protein